MLEAYATLFVGIVLGFLSPCISLFVRKGGLEVFAGVLWGWGTAALTLVLILPLGIPAVTAAGPAVAGMLISLFVTRDLR